MKPTIILVDDERSLSGVSEAKRKEFNGRPSYSRTITSELFDSLVEEVLPPSDKAILPQADFSSG